MIFSSHFRAFDGSDAFYKRLGVYDLDCCYLRGNPPGRPPANDGYYIVERVCHCCDKCVVVESVRWYALNGWAVGAIVSCPDFPYVAPGIFNTPTKKSIVVNEGCCNGDGSKIYMELTEPLGNPLP